MEQRLIDANKIKYRTVGAGGWNQPENVVSDYEIEKMPTVDAVEVVRCKNCINGIYDEANNIYKCVKSADYDPEYDDWLGFVSYHNADYYCADGERKENDRKRKAD